MRFRTPSRWNLKCVLETWDQHNRQQQWLAFSLGGGVFVLKFDTEDRLSGSNFVAAAQLYDGDFGIVHIGAVGATVSRMRKATSEPSISYGFATYAGQWKC